MENINFSDLCVTGDSEKEALFRMMQQMATILGPLNCEDCGNKVPLLSIEDAKCPVCGWDALSEGED